MKVSDLIKALSKCDENNEVFFEETTTVNDGGIEVGSISIVNSVYEVATRENDSKPWKVTRVVLSNEK